MKQSGWRWLTATRSRRLVLVVASLLVVLGMLSLFEPIYGKICDYNQYTDQERCRSQRLVIVLLTHGWRFVDSLNGFVTAVATALLTWITLRLAAMEQEGADTTRAQLRAYVSASPFEMGLHLDGKTIDFMTAIQNHGTTPAFKTCVFSSALVAPLPMKEDIFLKITKKDRDAVAPFTCWPGREPVAHTSRFVLTDENIAKLKTAGHGVLVVGKVEYVDSFGTNQWADFCSALDASELDRHVAQLRQSPNKRFAAVPFYFTQFNNDASNKLRNTDVRPSA